MLTILRILEVASAFLVLGSVGAMECETISVSQGILQIFLFIGLAVLLHRISVAVELNSPIKRKRGR